MITSQIGKRKDYYNKFNPKALSSLVKIFPKEVDILSKPSIIDCNQVEFIQKAELSSVFDSKGPFRFHSKIPFSIEKKIIEGIKKSPLVKPYFKNLLPDI